MLHRQSGNNLLIAGQREEAAQAILSIAAVGITAQIPAGQSRIIVLDSSAPGTPEHAHFDRLGELHGDRIQIARGPEIEPVMAELAGELARRGDAASPDDPSIFLLINGLQKFKKLRYEDDFSFSLDDDDDEAGGNPGTSSTIFSPKEPGSASMSSPASIPTTTSIAP